MLQAQWVTVVVTVMMVAGPRVVAVHVVAVWTIVGSTHVVWWTSTIVASASTMAHLAIEVVAAVSTIVVVHLMVVAAELIVMVAVHSAAHLATSSVSSMVSTTSAAEALMATTSTAKASRATHVIVMSASSLITEATSTAAS